MCDENKIRVLGITGLMASGKNEAALYLRREWGMAEIDLDRVGHLLLPALREPLRAAFGDAILDERGEVSRPLLARIVFSSERALDRLESIIHPAMRDETLRIIGRTKAAGAGHIIINAALLRHMRLNDFCGSVLFIDAPRELCIARALERGGRTRAELEAILDRQEKVNTRRDFADVVIGNAASLPEFQNALRAFAQTYFGSQADGDAAGTERDAGRAQEGTLYP